jgi:DNA polymerase
MVPALAKTDEDFLALQDHENPMVASAAQARLGVKSTLLECRIESFLSASKAVDGKLPITLNYYGADTTGRWSGWGYNPQNLPRVNPDKPKPSDALRNCLRAPDGYKVVVADLSGIELRVNHFLWKVRSSMAMYRADPEKADLYKDFAAKLYDKDVADVTKPERQVGKVAHLGLGFGAGSVTFQKVAKLMGGVDITLDESKDVVDKWRTAYWEIVQGWKTCHAALPHILSGSEGFEIDPWGLCVTHKEGIKTPKGLIRYPDLRCETSGGKKEWWYGNGRNKARIYAGKIDENIVQHLARCIIADNALKIEDMFGLRAAHTVHDELIYIVKDADAEQALADVQSVMRTPPSWWPELVVWSEGDIADTYGAAK